MKFINGGTPSTKTFIYDVYLPRLALFSKPKYGWGLWKVCCSDSSEFLGWVLIRPMDFFSDSPQQDNLEIGWRFKQSCWGKGIATEAALSVAKYVLELGYAKTLSAIALPDNHQSIRVMEKLGMTFVKTYLHNDPLGDAEVVLYEAHKPIY